MEKFWTVDGVARHYHSKEEAEKEAVNRSEEYPGRSFFVMEAVTKVVAPVAAIVCPIK